MTSLKLADDVTAAQRRPSVSAPECERRDPTIAHETTTHAPQRGRCARNAGIQVAEAVRVRAVLDDAKSDFAHAVRTLRSTPGFTAIAVVILAIGIGASAAIFTLIDRVLLQPLPVRDPDGLVLLGNGNGAGNAVGLQGGSFRLFSYDLYRRLRTLDGFQSLCAAQSTKSQIVVRTPGASTAEPAWAKLVSGNYFDVLGTRAAAGRLLRTGDDAAAADAVAVISFRYWKERLKGQASAIGTVVIVDRVPITIVGVAAAEFYGETLEADPRASGFLFPSIAISIRHALSSMRPTSTGCT
jgi:hypothetical protein